MTGIHSSCPQSVPFRLYGRIGCHLCDDMAQSLADMWPELAPDFRFTLIDVDQRPEWVERYGARVPVLVAPDGVELCEYFLDLAALRTYLQDLSHQ